MNTYKLKKWVIFLWLIAVLFISGCERPYLSGPIEIDFHNTTWYLEHEENLGSIYIKENGKFCIDKPLAEKMYYKSKVDSFGKNGICGEFSFDKQDHMAMFVLSGSGSMGTVLREPPNGRYFISIVVMSNGPSIEDGFLLQK